MEGMMIPISNLARWLGILFTGILAVAHSREPQGLVYAVLFVGFMASHKREENETY